LLTKELKENEEYEVFPDLEEGLTLKIRFEPGTFQTKNPYPQASRIDFLERDEQYTEKILDKIPNLDEVLIELSYQELKNKFFEMDEEPDAGATESEHKETRTRKTTKTDSEDEPKREKKSNETSRQDRPSAKKEPDPNELTWDQLQDMSASKLERLITDMDLPIESQDFEDDVNSLRKEIAKELEIEIPVSKKVSKDACVACQGTGVNSRGKECQICQGTGVKPKEKESDSETKEPIKRVTRNAVKQTDEETCPSGHKFGIDTDKKDDCDSCPAKTWNACSDAKDKSAKKK
jgi:hypothetical protein